MTISSGAATIAAFVFSGGASSTHVESAKAKLRARRKGKSRATRDSSSEDEEDPVSVSVRARYDKEREVAEEQQRAKRESRASAHAMNGDELPTYEHAAGGGKGSGRDWGVMSRFGPLLSRN